MDSRAQAYFDDDVVEVLEVVALVVEDDDDDDVVLVSVSERVEVRSTIKMKLTWRTMGLKC